MNLYSKICKK